MSTHIEWTQGLRTPTGDLMPGRTWNPTVGCTEVSRGCRECYAAKMAWRLMHNPKMKEDYAGTAKKLPNGRVVFSGKVNLLADRLSVPLETKRPTTWFVNSMSDLFHEDIPFEFIWEVFAVMYQTPHHIYQILTKRPERMLEFVQEYTFITETQSVSHVWLGTSVENQKAADQRMPPLKELSDLGWLTWVSNEPCVGKIDWAGWEFIRWMVTGGESGSEADPMHLDWALGARDFCEKNGIAFFFKQWGQWSPWIKGNVFTETNPLFCVKLNGEMSWIAGDMANNHVINHSENYEETDQPVQMVGKHNSGRVLDGRTHDAYPQLIRNSQNAK